MLSWDDNVTYVCIGRPFWKLRRLEPRPFEHNCAWAVIHFCKTHDHSKIPSGRGNILAWGPFNQKAGKLRWKWRRYLLTAIVHFFLNRNSLFAVSYSQASSYRHRHVQVTWRCYISSLVDINYFMYHWELSGVCGHQEKSRHEVSHG